MNAVIARLHPKGPKSGLTIDGLAIQHSARTVVEVEARAIYALIDRIDEKVAVACQLMLECRGRIVVTGIGKSGHIARKIAATMASTGTPAFFMHPAEASHGDLGMIRSEERRVGKEC